MARVYTLVDVEQELLRIAAVGDGEMRSAAARFFALPGHEQDSVLCATRRLANGLDDCGPALAFEMVAKAGRWLAREE